MIRNSAYAATILLLAAGACAPITSQEVDRNQGTLRGEWEAERFEIDGEVLDGQNVSLLKWVFLKDSVKITLLRTETGDNGTKILGASRTVEYKFSIDEGTQPKRINLKVQLNGMDVVRRGIFKLENGKLVICMGYDEFPKEFASGSGSKTTICTLKMRQDPPIKK